LGINYNWFKGGATTLPNQRVFNRYFKSGESCEKTPEFYGLEITQPIAGYLVENLHGDVGMF